MNLVPLIAMAALTALCFGEDVYLLREAEPIAQPAGYVAPGPGSKLSRFDRTARAPYWDSESGTMVFECCMPPVRAKNGVSHFYLRQYKLSADGKTLERHTYRWQSHEVPAKGPYITITSEQTDTPFEFKKGAQRYIVFTVNPDGEIVKVVEQNRAEQGRERVLYPADSAPSIVHKLF